MSDIGDLSQALRELVAENWDESIVPGFAVGMRWGDNRFHAAYGVTSVEVPQQVTVDTLFQIGSITKTYTCLALLTFVETGRFDLDTPLKKYLPEFRIDDRGTAEQVTIRHLLTHTGGWSGDFFIDTGRGADALARYVEQMAGLRQIAPLGRFFSYNNAGFNIAGRLIEIASGKPYEAAMQEIIFQPLGLSDTYFFADDVISRHFAVGHHPGEEGPQVARPWALARCGHAIGGIATSVSKLLDYAAFYLEDHAATRTPVIRPDTLAQMMSPQQAIWHDQEAVGLSWMINERDGQRILSHGGSTNGQNAGLTLVPAKQFAVAVLANSSQGQTIIGPVTEWALARFAGIQKEDDQPEIAVEDLAPYAGRYIRPFAEVTVALTNGRLQATMHYKGGFPTESDPPPPDPPVMRMSAVENDRFDLFNGEAKSGKADFFRREDGAIGWLRFSGRLHSKIKDPQMFL